MVGKALHKLHFAVVKNIILSGQHQYSQRLALPSDRHRRRVQRRYMSFQQTAQDSRIHSGEVLQVRAKLFPSLADQSAVLLENVTNGAFFRQELWE